MPVMTTSLFFGIATSIFFRLCTRAPLMIIWVLGLSVAIFICINHSNAEGHKNTDNFFSINTEDTIRFRMVATSTSPHRRDGRQLYCPNASNTGCPIFPFGSSICSNAAIVGAISVMCVSRLVEPCSMPQPIITKGIWASYEAHVPWVVPRERGEPLYHCGSRMIWIHPLRLGL